MKQPEVIEIRIGCNVVACERCEPYYWLGETSVYDNVADAPEIFMHVEVLPAVKAFSTGAARTKNPEFQYRIDTWYMKNPDSEPSLLRIKGLGLCFINVEVFAK